MPKSTHFKNIKVGQILLLSKSGSWVPVDAYNFFLRGSLIRTCTGSFGNVFGALNLRNIKVGQIFVLSKNGSWVLVDACNFFGGSLIRTCTGSFGNVFGGVNFGNNKVGQIFSSWKRRSWALVGACNFFFVGHNLGHAQEALDICQKAHTSKILK